MDQDIHQKFDELLITVKEGFDDVTERFNKVDGRLDRVEGRLDKVEQNIQEVKQDIRSIKSTSITKDYLDDKLADLGAEIGKRINAVMEKEKAFHKKLIEILRRHNVVAPEEIKELEEMTA